MSGQRRSLSERLWSKVEIGPHNECWLWTGATMHNGYGHIGEGPRGGRTLAAHRVAYEDALDPVPAGMYVLHTCDVRRCCNPNHLWLGTQHDNLMDMARKGRHPAQVKAAARRAVS